MFVDVSKDLRHVLVCGSFRPAFSSLRSARRRLSCPTGTRGLAAYSLVFVVEGRKRDRHHRYDDRRVCDVRVKSVDSMMTRLRHNRERDRQDDYNMATTRDARYSRPPSVTLRVDETCHVGQGDSNCRHGQSSGRHGDRGNVDMETGRVQTL